MRSRSYSAIVLSSFLLTTISCLGKQAPGSEKKEDRLPEYRPSSDFDKKEETKEDLPEAAEDEGEDTGGEGVVPEPGAPIPNDEELKDDCLKGRMRFEGRCLPKKEVETILERREQQALKRVQQAKMPNEAAHAAHDLLEKQIAQVDKAEDDLDEIIEELKKENRERTAKAAKAEKGPTPKEEQP